MASTPESIEKQSLLKSIYNHRAHIELIKNKQFFENLVQRADYAATQFKDIISKQKSSHMSNARLVETLYMPLLDDLDAIANEVTDPKEKQNFKKNIKTIREEILAFMPTIRATSVYKPNFPQLFPEFKWYGDTILFHSTIELGRFVEKICSAVLKTSKPTVSFTVQLPRASRNDQESERKDRSLNYARKIFEAAARAGFDPDEVKLTLDGKKINPKSDDYKEDYQKWTNLSYKSRISKISESSGFKAPERDMDDDTSSRPKP